MTEIATIDWFGRWGTSVFSENTAIFYIVPILLNILFMYVYIFDHIYMLCRFTFNCRIFILLSFTCTFAVQSHIHAH